MWMRQNYHLDRPIPKGHMAAQTIGNPAPRSTIHYYLCPVWSNYHHPVTLANITGNKTEFPNLQALPDQKHPKTNQNQSNKENKLVFIHRLLSILRYLSHLGYLIFDASLGPKP